MTNSKNKYLKWQGANPVVMCRRINWYIVTYLDKVPFLLLVSQCLQFLSQIYILNFKVACRPTDVYLTERFNSFRKGLKSSPV